MKGCLRRAWGWMKKRWKPLSIVAAVFLILASYPAFVLGYTWIKVLQSDLPGGRNGPLDAYRHTLASAVVSYTLNASAVEWVTDIMEDDRYLTQRMDRHNNRIGAMIGSEVSFFGEIEAAVAKSVSEGRVMARDPEQSTWLPKAMWKDKKMW